MTGVLIRREDRDRDTDQEKIMPGEDGGRDWSDASTNQGTPRIADNHQNLGEKQGTRSPLSLQWEPTLPTSRF